MSRATLLHRESSTKSLKTIVENAHRHRLLFDEYNIDVRNGQLVLTCLNIAPPPPTTAQTKNAANKQQAAPDEGFESDIDSISIISTDDSITSTSKHQETDSANGSSDSDDGGDSHRRLQQSSAPPPSSSSNINEEVFHLVNCVCYTDCKYPDILVFVIHNEALVFKFDKLEALQAFHSNFSTIKAVANQKSFYTTTTQPNKFNLLQRTDANGVTHIEISRQSEFRPKFDDTYEPTSIISINTPEDTNKTLILKKSLSSENLLDDCCQADSLIRKVWNSAENLLDAPKRPERRKKVKGPAPPPPIPQQQQQQHQQSNVMKGQFVRVKVDQKPAKEFKFQFLRPKPSPATNMPIIFHQFKFSDPKKIDAPINVKSLPSSNNQSWTSSMPRLLKKTKNEPPPRSFQPMAYRYTDATVTSTTSSYIPRYKTHTTNTISNRLFGMSSKLKEFHSVQSACNPNNKYQTTKDARYGSLGNLADGTLKSVIKKNDAMKSRKKVTFSAYNTVQVV